MNELSALTTTRPLAVQQLEAECRELFSEIVGVQMRIRAKLAFHADGKNLKGDELVGWLGEVYGKLLFGGKLVDDAAEDDFIVDNGFRVSVKTRRGWKSGWNQSSIIPRIDGNGWPTSSRRQTRMLSGVKGARRATFSQAAPDKEGCQAV